MMIILFCIIFGILVIGSLYTIERELREIKHILREAADKNKKGE